MFESKSFSSLKRYFTYSQIVLAFLFASHAVVASELEIGAGVFYASLPDYLGSDEQSSYLLPLPYLYYKNDKFELDRNVFTGYLWRSNDWT